MMSLPVLLPGSIFFHGVYDVTSCLVAWYHVPSGGVMLSRCGPWGWGGGRHPQSQWQTPPVLTSCEGYCTSRYTSYWNVFLFLECFWHLADL